MSARRLFFAFLGILLLQPWMLVPQAARAAGLTEIIEGAKKEGAATVMLRSGFTQKSMDRLRKEIKDKFNADLDIKFTPSGSMPKRLAAAIMEQKVGAPPSFDLMNFSSHVVEGMEAGIFERVDWKPLLLEGTNPDVVMDMPATKGAIIYYNGHQGMMYNPEKVPRNRVPKSLKELADPQWKGKVGIFEYTNSWTRSAFILGKEKLMSDLRAIMKNGAILGRYSDLYNRYLLGEITLSVMSSAYLKMAKDKGVPVAWQSLDFADVQNFSLSVRTGARHPNAAKLIALYLAGPQGARFTLEESQAGNMYYPGNYEHEISQQDKAQGVRVVFPERDPKIINFVRSAEYDRWEKEIKLLLETGGKS